MSLDDLLIHYSDFISSINDIYILSKLSLQVFDKYPKNIPKDIYQPIADDLAYSKEVIDLIFADEFEKNQAKITKYKDKSELSALFVESVFAKAAQESLLSENKEVDTTYKIKSVFKKMIIEEEFLSYYSLFDAFINSVIMVIFKRNPEKLSPKGLPDDDKRNIRWDDVLQFDNYDDLISFMIEKYIYGFGYNSLYDRLNILQTDKRFDLQISIKNDDKKLLDEITELRNCFVHNGGRVTNKSLDKLRNPDVNAGDKIILELETNKEVHNYFKEKAFLLFDKTIKKYFKKEFDEKIKFNIWIKFISGKVRPLED